MAKAGRGEIWQIDLELVQKASSLFGLSVSFLDHERAVVTYIPRTTHVRQTRFEVAHRARGFEPGVFDVQGIGSIPEVKLERRLGFVDSSTLQQVEAAIKLWLNLH
jgi:mRNA interferase MazF